MQYLFYVHHQELLENHFVEPVGIIKLPDSDIPAPIKFYFLVVET